MFIAPSLFTLLGNWLWMDHFNLSKNKQGINKMVIGMRSCLVLTISPGTLQTSIFFDEMPLRNDLRSTKREISSLFVSCSAHDIKCS